jgi:hypothetical protein
LIDRADLSGPINLCSPHPLPNRESMACVRSAVGARFALPAPAWILEIGAFFLRTETELLLKSRYVVPRVLLEAGFRFSQPNWDKASRKLARRL